MHTCGTPPPDRLGLVDQSPPDVNVDSHDKLLPVSQPHEMRDDYIGLVLALARAVFMLETLR